MLHLSSARKLCQENSKFKVYKFSMKGYLAALVIKKTENIPSNALEQK